MTFETPKPLSRLSSHGVPTPKFPKQSARLAISSLTQCSTGKTLSLNLKTWES
jgi:hypothetical protein